MLLLLTWCNNESEMKRNVNADGNESFTKICVCGTNSDGIGVLP